MVSEKPIRRIVGCMTGTSIDGLDVALIEVSGSELEIKAEFLRGVTRSLGETGETLRQFASGAALTAKVIAEISRDFALLHATAVRDLLAGESADLVAVHGQTLYHKPAVSWQLFNAGLLAAELGIPVVSDFRSLDLARGGEGAPITPLSDFISFRDEHKNRVVVNFGGFINITLLPRRPEDSKIEEWLRLVTGRDVSVCNQLLDRAAEMALGKPYDEGGSVALSGSPDEKAVSTLVEALRRQASSGKSLGSAAEVVRLLPDLQGRLNPPDFLRSVVAAIATVLVEAVGQSDAEILAAGGGAQNLALMNEVAKRSTAPIRLTDDCGVPAAYREAVAMATLGALAMDKVPITLTQVTSASQPSNPGCWVYP